MPWESYDTVGLLSCIIGTVLLVIPLPVAFAEYIWLGGGGAVVVMGIVAVSNHSKIGIGGIIIGSVLILIGFLEII